MQAPVVGLYEIPRLPGTGHQAPLKSSLVHGLDYGAVETGGSDQAHLFRDNAFRQVQCIGNLLMRQFGVELES